MAWHRAATVDKCASSLQKMLRSVDGEQRKESKTPCCLNGVLGYVCSSGGIRTCCRLWRLFRWYTEITCFRFASNRKLFYRHLEFERVFHSFLYVAWRDWPCLLSPRMDPKLAVTICGHQEEVPACAYVGFLTSLRTGVTFLINVGSKFFHTAARRLFKWGERWPEFESLAPIYV